MFESLLQDCRYSFRSLAKNKGTTFWALCTLGLGLGVNGAAFALLNHLALSPPQHVANPERVVHLSFQEARPDGRIRSTIAPKFQFYEFLVRHVEDRIQLSAQASIRTGFGTGFQSEDIRVGFVSPNFFEMLGVGPLIGQFFSVSESNRGSDLAVLNWDFWRRKYGSDPSIIGRRCWIGDRPYLVMGVAPQGFHGTERERLDVWLPLQELFSFRIQPLGFPRTRSSSRVHIVARLGKSIRLEQAESAILALSSAEEVLSYTRPIAGVRMHPVSTPRGWSDPVIRISAWSMAGALLILLVSLASVANLLLSRNQSRINEFAIRMQLGCSRGRLLRMLLTESFFVSVLGLFAAIFLLFASVSLFSSYLLERAPYWRELFNIRTTTLLLLTTPLAAVSVGLAPALRVGSLPLLQALKDNRASKGRSRIPQVLVAVQVALASVLLVGSGLFLRSLVNVSQVHIGLDPEKVFAVLLPGAQGTLQAGQIESLFTRMLLRVRTMPGVEAAALSTQVPGLVTGPAGKLTIPNHPLESMYKIEGHYVTDGYFKTLGLDILRGRAFTPTDTLSSELVAAVNQEMARSFLPGTDPIGQCIYLNDRSECTRIVALVEDSLSIGVVSDPVAQLYVPLAQTSFYGFRFPPTPRALFVRASSTREQVLSILVGQHLGGGQFPYLDVRLLYSYLQDDYQPWLLGSTISGYFGVLALIVTVVGLYGQVSLFLEQRRREIGIRRAFGAQGSNIVRFLVRRTGVPVGSGIVFGLAGALIMGEAIESLLFGVKGNDPLTLAGIVLLVLLTCTMACLRPIKQACRVAPIETLQYE